MDSRIAALRAHVKRVQYEQFQGGPHSNLLHPLRSGARGLRRRCRCRRRRRRRYIHNEPAPRRLHTHTHTHERTIPPRRATCYESASAPRPRSRSVIVVALVVGLPQPPQVLRSAAAARWKFEISHVGWPEATGRGTWDGVGGAGSSYRRVVERSRRAESLCRCVRRYTRSWPEEEEIRLRPPADRVEGVRQGEGTDVSEYGKVRKIRERRREAGTRQATASPLLDRCTPFHDTHRRHRTALHPQSQRRAHRRLRFRLPRDCARVNSVERDTRWLRGGWERVVCKERGETCSEGMNPITRKPRTYDPLLRAVFFSLFSPLCLTLRLLPAWHRSVFIRDFFASFREQANGGAQGRWSRVHTASFSGFLVFFFSRLYFSSSFCFLLSPLSLPFVSSFLHHFRPSWFTCILTRLHARGFAVRPDYPTARPPSFPSSSPATMVLARLPLSYTTRHNSSRTLVPFSPSSVAARGRALSLSLSFSHLPVSRFFSF